MTMYLVRYFTCTYLFLFNLYTLYSGSNNIFPLISQFVRISICIIDQKLVKTIQVAITILSPPNLVYRPSTGLVYWSSKTADQVRDELFGVHKMLKMLKHF